MVHGVGISVTTSSHMKEWHMGTSLPMKNSVLPSWCPHGALSLAVWLCTLKYKGQYSRINKEKSSTWRLETKINIKKKESRENRDKAGSKRKGKNSNVNPREKTMAPER